MSQRPPSLLIDTLCDVRDLLELLVVFPSYTRDGRQLEASRCLTTVFGAAPSLLPVVKGLITAQRQAAEADDLTQRPDRRVIASIGIAAKQPDPANSEHPATPDTTQPAA